MGRSPHDGGRRDAACARCQWARSTGRMRVVTQRSAEARVARLIELGRDREAASLAAATPPTSGGTMEPLDQLDTLGPILAGVVAGISPDQLDDATPCDGFTVRGVLEHMVGGATAFAAAFRGQSPGAAPAGDALAAFGPALSDLAAAMHEPGALDRTVQAPFGAVPGATFARFV